MGLGPTIIELYRQLKLQGALEGVTNVIELGSQDYWCPQQNLMRGLFTAFGRGEPAAKLLSTTNVNQLPARLLYTALGIDYTCVDVDRRPGSVLMDLNFDSVPVEHKGKYGLVTNHGTSEHILNQYNVFKSMHDFARVGAVFVHAVPFTVHLEHGFFNYQPNFFRALARYNSYETLGVWIGPDWQIASFIPWDPILLDYLTLSAKTTHLLVVAQRKMFEREFCVPFQEEYETKMPEALNRYSRVIDGEILDSRQVNNWRLREIPGRTLALELGRRIKRRFGLKID
jgi:hypothetical protein